MLEFLSAALMWIPLAFALASDPAAGGDPAGGEPAPTPPAPTPGDETAVAEPSPPPSPEDAARTAIGKFKSGQERDQAYIKSEKRLGEVQNEVGQLRTILTEVLSRTGQPTPAAAPAAPEPTPEEEQGARVKATAQILKSWEQGEITEDEAARRLDENQQRQILAAVETAVTPLYQSYQQDVGPSAIEREAAAQFDAMKRVNPKLASLDSRQIAVAVAQRANIEQWRGVPEDARRQFIEDVAYLELGRAVAATGKVPTVPGAPPALEPEPVGGGRTGAGGVMMERESRVAHMIETSGGLITKEQAEAIADGKEMPLLSEIKR